ncbi:MAG: tetratricopeptide repeat protein [Verrucomicrobiota bacterium]
MLGLLFFDSPWFSGPLGLVFLIFNIWMLIDAVRRDEWVWALFILFIPVINAILYYFFVYRASGGGGASLQGFELPGASARRRIKELQDQIHHLDKAHHHSQLGDVYFQRGKLADAEKSYRAAMERDAEDIDTRAHFGQCLLRQQRPTEALPLLEGVCAENPKHDYGHSLMALAETYAALGQTDKAVATLERVLETNSYSRARVQLAELYASLNRLDEARGLVKEVLEDDAHAPAFQRRRERVWIRRAKKLLSRL